MKLIDYITLIGVLLTGITAIPIIRELFPPGIGHHMKTASFAQEALSGRCDSHQRTYWTNARNHALKQIEARQAYPEQRKRSGFYAIFVGITLCVSAGGLTLAATTNVFELIAVGVMLLIATYSFLMGTLAIRDVEKARRSILGSSNQSLTTVPFVFRICGLSLLGYMVGLASSLRGIEPTSKHSVLILLLLLVSLFYGGAFLIMAWLYSEDARADAHLLLKDEPQEPSN